MATFFVSAAIYFLNIASVGQNLRLAGRALSAIVLNLRG
jgi:hypothetical protein